MRRITLTTIVVTLMAVAFSASSATDEPALSRETLYIAERQFGVEPSALSGVWRWAPRDVTFSESSISALLARSFGSDSVKEIGRMQFWDKNYLVAVVLMKSRDTDLAAKRHFVFFSEDRPISYKIVDYNPMQLIVPPAVPVATAVQDACAMIHTRLARYPHTRNLLSASQATGDRPAPRCEISFQSSAALLKGDSPIYAFVVQSGDELFRQGWMQDTQYAADGDNGTRYGMRNEQVGCLFDWNWDRPEEGKDAVNGRIRCLVE